MILKKLEIYGFKSFADRIYMKFDKGITAIVGPNGSGKSNIADAVRWVLGEQSAKSLRGSKMEDVIFSGTEVRKALGFAEVSLTLDNTDGTLPLDYSEVTITRRVFRSGESEYYINRSACRLKDIVELFMDTGVGKEGYSIIGQGRIDEILSTRSEERRYIFEEAAGIVKYKARREEAEKKLEKTLDNLMRAEDILSELELQLGPLEEQSRKAKEYLKLKEQLKIYEINQFLRQYDQHMERISQLKNQIALLEEEAATRKLELIKKEEGREALSNALSGLKQAVDDIRKERYDLLNESERLKGELNLNLERIKQFERDNARLSEEISNDGLLKEQCLDQLESLNNIIETRNQVFEEIRSKSAELAEKLAELDQDIAGYQRQIDETKGNIIHVLNKIADCRSQLTRYRTIEGSLKERLEKIRELSGDKASELESLSGLASSLHNKIMSTNRKIQEKQKEKTSLEDTIKDMKQALYTREDEIQKAKQQLEGKSSRLKLLEDMKKGYEGFNKTVKEVLTACQSNPTVAHKVCGVVASLISVPKEYEAAVETALGSSLQHIVTEDEEDAKYLIEFLRRNNYGRATFLPVSSVRGRGLTDREREVLKMKGCCGIASELVSCDPKYKGILESLLGRVVIADDLDSAVLMARRFNYAFRIVTLIGDVVNTGGSLTGGSSAVRSISILGRNREISDLQKEIAARQSALAELEMQRDEMLNTYREHKNKLEELEAVLKGIEQQKVSVEESLHQVSTQKAQVEKDIAVFDNEKLQINQDLEELQASIEQVEQDLHDLEEKNEGINEWARESERYLREKQEQKAAVSEDLTGLRIKTAAIQQEIQGLRDQAKRIQDDIARYSEAITAKQQQCLRNKEEIHNINKSIDQAKETISEQERRSAELQAAIEEKEKERIKEEGRLQELEKEIRELNQTAGDLTDRKYRIEVQCSRYEVELENFQNNIWEEYEITYSNAIPYKDESLTLTAVNQEIQKLKKEISALGEVNVNAIEEYKRVSERYNFLNEQRNDLLTAKENLREVIRDITATMKKRFQEEFAAINRHFGTAFSKLFGGGHARLVLEDPEDVLNCGIEIIAQPPGKKLQSLSLLSGGERALTAIAILFAILKHKPTPFCVLDEIDAALDDSNVYQFGKYIKEFSKDTQFAIITHRKGTMEVSDVLYGIAMEEKGISKLISVKFDEMVS